MGTLKKFFRYFLLFIALFIFVQVLRELSLKKDEERYLSNYTVNVNSPKILVTTSRVTDNGGIIKGYIFNETGEHIKDKVLQFDFYDKNNKYLGTEVKQINYFNVKEKINFDISYTYKKVDRIEVLYLDEALEHKEEKSNDIIGMLNTDNETVKMVLPVVAVLTMVMIIP